MLDGLFTFCFAVTVSQLEIVSSACRVLLKYLINCLQTSITDPNSSEIERYLKAVQTLCVTTGLFNADEVASLINIMKGESIVAQSNVQASNGINFFLLYLLL